MVRKPVAGKRRPRTGLLLVLMIVVGVLVPRAFGLLAKPAGLVAKLGVDYIVVDLIKGNYHVRPELAKSAGGTEPFTSMVDRLKPYAAICGTYYDENYRPLGDIVSGGKVISRGCQRQGIGFTSAGKIKFYERKNNSKIDWSGCVSGISCGPRLVRDGKKSINVKRDGFSAAAATNKAWRCAVGETKDDKLIICAVTRSVTLDMLADVMLELGAYNAINLDGGSMCALYVDGKYRVEPVKSMNNILAVYRAK